ncbi:hypothetical protein Tco_0675791 [Tanacetum coccineum]
MLFYGVSIKLNLMKAFLYGTLLPLFATNQDGSDIDICRMESNHISDSLMYLLVTYPVMLPIGIGMIRLALTLKKMEKERMWKVMSQVWIEILAYAATHCRGFHHLQQLRKGGEFLTHVWLLMAHLGITEQVPGVPRPC